MNGWVLLSLATLGAVCHVAIGPGVVTHSHPHSTHKVSHKHASHTTSVSPPTQTTTVTVATTPTSTPVTVTTDVTTTQSVATTPRYVVTTKKAPTTVVVTVSSDAATIATKGASASVSTTSGLTSQATTMLPTTTVPTTTQTTTMLLTTTTVPTTTETTTMLPTTTVSTTTETTTTPKPTSPPTTTPNPKANKTVCYDVVGCFDNYSPFNNANLDLPVDPGMIGTGFWLYSRASNDSTDYDELKYTDSTSVMASRFDPKKLTKVLVHGFNNNGNTTWVQRFRAKLLLKGDFNVIVVDWGRGAKFGKYDQAVANTRLVGTQLKLILEMLMGAGLHLEDVHLLGHSLGAHTSGYTGRLLGGKISRISGFDPADPDFRDYPLAVRLDMTDARFVDVTHTNAGFLGIVTASGHVDFYVNGGTYQPGCPKDMFSSALGSLFGGKTGDVGCSHGRSYDVFMESMFTTCPFTAYPCSSYDTFQRGQCLTCGQTGCTEYGYYCDQYFARGKMYLNTASKPPFCGYHYGVEVSAPPSAEETKGKLYISLIGNWGSTGFIQLNGDQTLTQGGRVAGIILAPKEVGDITVVEVKYVKHSGFFFSSLGVQDHYAVSKIAVLSGENGSKYVVCGTHTLPHNNAVRMTVSTKATC